MRGSPLLTMVWRDVLFAHWPVPPAVVDDSLPPELLADTYDGEAWLGVVAFRMDPIKPRFSPVGLTFDELNLRTYVRPADSEDEESTDPTGGPGGIYFYNLDASDRLSVTIARTLFDLPYYTADSQVTRRGETVRFRSRRTHPNAPPNRFGATYRPTGDAFRPDPGSKAAFLTERYRFYTASDGLAVGEIGHDPWTLRLAAATIETNTLFESNGFEIPEGDPLVHYSRALPVEAARPWSY
jgi:uncharacterized protein